MHPPVHRLLGWASRPSAFAQRRLVWRLDQLRGLGEQEVFVKGEPAETDAVTLERLPTLIDAALTGADDLPLGLVADAAVELRSGRILHYLVARSDPRLPGTSRWRLSPDRIVDQQPGRVFTALRGLDDLPVARASVRQQLLRRSRRWKEQVQEVGGRVEERLEGWLEEPPGRRPSARRSPGPSVSGTPPGNAATPTTRTQAGPTPTRRIVTPASRTNPTRSKTGPKRRSRWRSPGSSGSPASRPRRSRRPAATATGAGSPTGTTTPGSDTGGPLPRPRWFLPRPRPSRCPRPCARRA